MAETQIDGAFGLEPLINQIGNGLQNTDDTAFVIQRASPQTVPSRIIPAKGGTSQALSVPGITGTTS